MLRGEVWTYVPQGSSRRLVVVIVSSDGVNQSVRPWLLGVPVGTEDSQDILAVQVEDHGWAAAGNLTRLYRGWLRERIGGLDRETVDVLDAALRAALDL